MQETNEVRSMTEIKRRAIYSAHWLLINLINVWHGCQGAIKNCPAEHLCLLNLLLYVLNAASIMAARASCEQEMRKLRIFLSYNQIFFPIFLKPPTGRQSTVFWVSCFLKLLPVISTLF